MEIERKFLVKSLPPGWNRSAATRIRQGYFNLRGNQLQIRLRQKGNRSFITIKTGQGRVRQEEGIPITHRQFESLWPLVRSASILKQRFEIPFRQWRIELDEYEGAHRGLRTAEIEFASRRQSESFKPPPWLGREVTGQRHYCE